MATIQSLRVVLEASTAGFTNAMSRARRSLRDFSARVGRVAAASARAFARMARGVAGAAAAMAASATAAFARMVNAGTEVADLAARLGTTAKALTELRFVASQSGVEFGTFTTALQRMTRRINEVAETGKGVAAAALEELGLKARALNELTLDKKFEEIAEAMSKLDDPAKRVRLAMALFDTEGVKLVQTMGDGAAGVQKMRRQANALGDTLDTRQTKLLQRVSAAWDKLTSAARGFIQRTLIKFAPDVIRVLSTITRAFASNFASLAGYFEIARSHALGVWEDITGAFGGAADFFGNLFSGQFGKALDQLRLGVDGMRRVLNGFVIDLLDWGIITEGRASAIVETMEAVFATVKATFVGVGTAIGGVAAAVGAVASGNFSGAGSIIGSLSDDVQRAVRASIDVSLNTRGVERDNTDASLGNIESASVAQLEIQRQMLRALQGPAVAQ